MQVEKKFTRKEGKPFAVLWIEDLTDMLEVVVWNEVYLKVSDALATGRVVEIKGTLDKRDEALRATALEIRSLALGKTNGANERSGDSPEEPVVLLQFSPATTGDELRRYARFWSARRAGGQFNCCLIAKMAIPCAWMLGAEFRVNLTQELEEKLSRWLVTPKLQ